MGVVSTAPAGMAVVLNQTASASTINSTPSIALGLDELFAASTKAAVVSPTVTSGAGTAQWIERIPNAGAGSVSRTVAAGFVCRPFANDRPVDGQRYLGRKR
jgi:hypothetical protein